MPPVNSSVGRDKRTLSSFPSLKGKGGRRGWEKKKTRFAEETIDWLVSIRGGKRKTGGRAKVEKWRQWVKYLVPVFFFCPEINSPMAMVTERGGKKERCVS